MGYLFGAFSSHKGEVLEEEEEREEEEEQEEEEDEEHDGA